MFKHTLSNLQYFMFDLDGTIYLDDRVFFGAKELLHLLKEQDKSFLFLTNNSSKGVNEYIEKLKMLGIAVEPSNVLISSEVTADYIKSLNNGRRVFLLGTDGFKEELWEKRFRDNRNRPGLCGFGS